MKTLAVVVFAWGGSRPIYLPWHVHNTKRMVGKHLTVPHKFVVVTDDPEAHVADGIEVVPLWSCPEHETLKRHWVNCYVRLGLFDKDIGGKIADRILAIDLDAVIRSNIDDLVADDAPFRIMNVYSRKWLQGGLFRVEPGKVTPCPWDQIIRHEETKILERSAKWCGSDQAVMSELFYDRVMSGEIPRYDETHGMAINDWTSPWRVFFRTGHRKCWEEGVPELGDYLRESGLTEVPAGLPFARTTTGADARTPLKTISRVRDTNVRRVGRVRKID
jgi:hypothetical protein